MSRPKNERARSRLAQIHYCAMCIADAGGDAEALLETKKLTWMIEIPPESDTCTKLGGRARTWFCRGCVAQTCEEDTIFRERNGHLELEDPAWWNDPASERQLEHLARLLVKRIVPDGLQQEIEERIAAATKGDLNQWLTILENLEWKPRDEESTNILSTMATPSTAVH